MRFKAIAGTACLMFGITCTATATTIPDGFTFADASDMVAKVIGQHFPSKDSKSLGKSLGKSAGKAEVGGSKTKVGGSSTKVGSFSTEETLVLSETDRTGPSRETSPFVGYKVFGLNGLLSEPNGSQRLDDIAIAPSAVKSFADIADFEPAAGAGAFGTVDTAGSSIDDTLNADIASSLSSPIGHGGGSPGIRQAAAGNPDGGNATFDGLHRAVDNQTSVVPVPAALPLLLAGLAAIGLIARRRTKRPA